MRINSVGSSRPNYYDRNPLVIDNSFGIIGAAPHGATTRWTYTVPTGRKFLTGAASGWIRTNTAAGTNGRRSIRVIAFHAVGANVIGLAHYNNAVDSFTDASNAPSTVLGAADTFNASTQDTSVTGTADYQIDASGTEFDA